MTEWITNEISSTKIIDNGNYTAKSTPYTDDSKTTIYIVCGVLAFVFVSLVVAIFLWKQKGTSNIKIESKIVEVIIASNNLVFQLK